MAPTTITEVSLIEKPEVNTEKECHENTEEITCKPRQRVKKLSAVEELARKVDDEYTGNAYEDSLPKNDFWFLAPLRELEREFGFVTALRYENLIAIVGFHFITMCAILFTIYRAEWPRWQTVVFGAIMGNIVGFGVTAGAHRYWCHRSYKAKLPLQLLLMLCFSASGQNNIFEWVRDHRVHHKFSETSADPHDVRRGFWFAHVGWLMMKKHPCVRREGAKIDMSDIVNDPLIRFHTKYFLVFKALCCFILPTLIPLLWGESLLYCVVSQPMLRYMLSLNFTWSVNSFAHLWGNKPYDKSIKPVENWCVSAMSMGEGWHNYHHTFPWDYKAAELPYYINMATMMLDMFAKIGWAYDMKQASPALIRAVAKNRAHLA